MSTAAELAPVFVVGAPRSGTTYLQNMLGSHPQIVTSQETDLFTHYLSSWEKLWRHHAPEDPQQWLSQRHKGLPAVLTRENFDSIMRAAVEEVLGATLALKPGARVIVDKNPQNILQGELILRLLPAARFIQIVRDGRDVVVSQLRAARDWGRTWAPSSATAAAEFWRDCVLGGRRIGELTSAYTEVRYEDLLAADGPEVLQKTFTFCGVEATLEECQSIHANYALDRSGAPRSSLVWGGEVRRRLNAAPPEPKGFSGEGGPGAWRQELGVTGRVAVDQAAGSLLRSLGYVDGSDWIGVEEPRRRAALATLAAHAMLNRGRNRVATRLRA
jgi:hypothetical protein